MDSVFWQIWERLVCLNGIQQTEQGSCTTSSLQIKQQGYGLLRGQHSRSSQNSPLVLETLFRPAIKTITPLNLE